MRLDNTAVSTESSGPQRYPLDFESPPTTLLRTLMSLSSNRFAERVLSRSRKLRRQAVKWAKRARLIRTVGFSSLDRKGGEELGYWQGRLTKESDLGNRWYRYFYTEHFHLPPTFYSGRRNLDLGCGPRGSPEWAEDATLRVGIGPLAHRYGALGTSRHDMLYVSALGENLPVADGSFVVVGSFHSLDHVDILREVAAEIVRVLAPGGIFLLLVDVNHNPTDSEPLRLPWSVVDNFGPSLELVGRSHSSAQRASQSIIQDKVFDHSAGSDRWGVLSAMFKKPSERV